MWSNFVIDFLKSWRFFLVLLVLFVVSGCGQQNKEIYRDSWKEDVLVTQDCGLDGLSCCFNKEQKCQFGLECCLNPLDQSKGFCSESCEYGKIGKYCRRDEPHCDDTAVCVDGYCVQCGLVGNPCCVGDKCLDQDKKGALHAECLKGICSLCGSSGELTCPGEFKCELGNLDNGGYCNKCGDFTKPCCAGDKPCGKGMSCHLGFCS